EMSQHVTAPSDGHEQVTALTQTGSGQRIITAETGNLVIMPSKEIWMDLVKAETHIWDPHKPDQYDRTRNDRQRIRLPSIGTGFDSTQLSRSLRELSLRELIDQERLLQRSKSEDDRILRNLARVEIHKKFSIPFACIAFGVLGLPLGITNRRGG